MLLVGGHYKHRHLAQMLNIYTKDFALIQLDGLSVTSSPIKGNRASPKDCDETRLACKIIKS